MKTAHPDKSSAQHPAFYAILVMLIIMAVGLIALMFINSFKLDVDIISGHTHIVRDFDRDLHYFWDIVSC